MCADFSNMPKDWAVVLYARLYSQGAVPTLLCG